MNNLDKAKIVEYSVHFYELFRVSDNKLSLMNAFP